MIKWPLVLPHPSGDDISHQQPHRGRIQQWSSDFQNKSKGYVLQLISQIKYVWAGKQAAFWRVSFLRNTEAVLLLQALLLHIALIPNIKQKGTNDLKIIQLAFKSACRVLSLFIGKWNDETQKKKERERSSERCCDWLALAQLAVNKP